MELTPERLNLEYLQWTVQYPDSIDNDDLTFGQFISNKYLYDSNEDIASVEDTDIAYEALHSSLELNKVENTL